MKDFFYKLSVSLSRFMIGRNGYDKLARWCLGFALVFAFVSMIFPNNFCLLVAYAFLFYSLFRVLSRNIYARQNENMRFENFLGKASSKFQFISTKIGKKKRAKSAQRKDPAKLYFTCTRCNQSLSVPKGKGTLKITCPKCKHQTTIKS
jgi:DNA-directed RNA polymerase subunit RPC12/RpoP